MISSLSQVLISSGSTKKFLYDFSIAASCREPLAVAKNQHLIALVEWLCCADVRRVHDHGAMYAKECVTGQTRLEMRKRLSHVIGRIGKMNTRDIVASLDPVNLGGVEEKNLAMNFHRKPTR